MTVRIFAFDTDYFFHSQELRALKVEDGQITVTLTNKDVLVLGHDHAREIAKDILEAIEKNEDMSFPIHSLKLN